MDNNYQQSAQDAFNQAKANIKNVKSVEDAFKLPWYYPLIAALTLILMVALAAIAWYAVAAGYLLTIIIAIFQAQGKPSPIKMQWYWLLLPTVALTLLLAFPPLTGWIIFGLFAWALGAGLLHFKPWKDSGIEEQN